MSLAPFPFDFSLIVLNWNGLAYVERCLDSLLAQDYPRFEIIVVDNASTDGSVQMIREHYPTIRLITNRENRGFAGGVNVGLRAAQGYLVALLNNDVILRSTWVLEMAQAMRADPQLGVAGGKLLYPDEKTLQHAGGYFHLPAIAMPDHYGYRQPDQPQYQIQREVEFVTGAAMTIRRAVIEDIGLLDEGFTFYYEETDFEFRARRAGWKIAYIPEAVGIHLESMSTVRDSYNFFWHFHRSRLRFLLKNYGWQRFLSDSLPAEFDWLKNIHMPVQLRALRWAYLETLLSFGNIPDLSRPGQMIDADTYHRGMASFQQLRQATIAQQIQTNAWAE